MSDSDSHPTAMARRRIAELAGAMRFFSRLPVPHIVAEDDPAAPPSMARMAWAVPVAGALVALPGAVVLWIGHALALPGLLAGALAVLALVATTGALHEDGLSDTLDGFGGGRTRERKLEIMRDSRIGAYGAAGLVLSILIRTISLAALVDAAGPWTAIAGLLGGQSLSRLAAIGVMALLPPARPGGLSASAGRPSGGDFANAILVAALMALLILGPAFGLLAPLIGLVIAVAVTLGIAGLAEREIGGQTGDVAGATQQAAEIALLVTFVAAR
ncbi:adenosylcobinamide-GDP ribazoletransferase [Segnochrobactrum spirostomi]|nr:adenosylcobinamide-GDP ribazoletransferase [Segnochrobactrum spirostomi]